MNRCPDRQFTLAESPSSRESLPTEAVTWLEQFYAENIPRDDFSERKVEVLNEIEQTGTYHQQPVELAFGAKVAWRNSVRCVGRLYWKSLIVRDCRHLRTAEDVFAALLDHLRIATNRGMVLPVITIFAPVVGNQTGIRIWNHQLVGYAGYTESNHHIIGDPLNVEFTRRVQSLGWRNQTNGSFDLLPIVIQMEAEQPKWFELPQDVVLEIPLRHPDFSWFEDLDLKWYTTPVISDMRLEIGGLSYTAAPFGGWYVGSEIGARDLADVGRYNLLPAIAERMNLDTSSDQTLWRDRAFVELNRAVLFSFGKYGARITDHHTVTRQFIRHELLESRQNRKTYADWSWIVPPISGATTPVFHRCFENRILKPNFFYQAPAWK